MKRSKTPTSRKVILMLYGASLILSGGMIAYLDHGETEALKNGASARAGAVTSTLSAQLDGGRVTHLLKQYDSRGMLVKNTQDAWYYVLHESLRKSAAAAHLELPLLVVAYDAHKQELQTVVSSADKPVLRDAYHGPGADLILAFLTSDRGAGQRVVTQDMLLSIDAVRNSRGAIIGVVVARSPMAELQALARTHLWRDIIAAIIILLVIGILLFRNVGRLMRHEEAEYNDLQLRHNGVTDSIAYAGKIQTALLPSVDKFSEQFDDYFVLNRPKDVVSGDFHWYQQIDDHTCFVATADCTGHGVPGAMMAAIGCSLLNELAANDPAMDPAELLTELNRRMLGTLHQEGRPTGAGDGMDIALCRIDRNAKEILFAGAFRPLYWMHEGQLTVINGDRLPIGGAQHDMDRKFTVHRVAYHSGDRIYLFSDGYVDQFGGPERRKFMTSRFNDMIMANHHMPMAMQAEVIEREFLAWKGAHEQVDDVCVLGIAV